MPEDPEQWSDLELALRCAARDDAAWRELLRRAGPHAAGAMRRVFARAGVPDPAREASEALGSVVEALLGRDASLLRSYRPLAPLAVYVAVVARNVALSLLKPRRVHLSLEAPAPGGKALAELLEAGADPGGVGTELLESALASLPAREQVALRLAYWEGLSYAGIARVLDVAESSMGMLMTRARKRLRDALEREIGKKPV